MSGEVGKWASGEAVMLLLLWAFALPAQQPVVIDGFEQPSGWGAAPSDGVTLSIRSDSGRTGLAMRLDFDFQGHGGYAVARKTVRIDLPENYAFTFWIRGEAPVNNLEFKLVDSTGDNVWWRNQRNFTFSSEWKKVTIRKRQVEFAWGPKGGGEAKDIRSIELAITAGSGGKGRVWIDDFRLEPRPPERPYDQVPVVTASSSGTLMQPEKAIDGDSTTAWASARPNSDEWMEIDFGRNREFGGLTIAWERERHPQEYTVEFEDEASRWVHRLELHSNGGRDHLYLPESETRRIRIRMPASVGRFAIKEILVHPLDWSASPNAFFRNVARDAPAGSFPRYFTDVQTYWTMVGGNGDGRRSLLSQDGSFEPVAGGFSVEPFILADRVLRTWADAIPRQSLHEGYLPIPTVALQTGGITLKVTAFSTGAGDSASAYTWYRLQNTGPSSQKGTLYLTVRPFQVNPPWQFLGVAGGVARIDSLEWNDLSVLVNGAARIVPATQPAGFGAATFDQGDITEFLREGRTPESRSIRDPFGSASGVLAYPFELAPNALTDVFLRFPLNDQSVPDTTWSKNPAGPLTATIEGWKSLLNRVTIDLPPSAQPIEDALKTTLAYMLINRDGPAIEPGARSYRRAWIRDGAMIGAAFLRLGHPEPVRQFIEWYAPYQYDSGKVPCCVDSRGSDPVPEHDSHGELIHIIAEYYRYTGDRVFLERMWPHVVAAARYIDSMRSTRRTPEYAQGSNQKYFGLMPPSISHEGYSAKPVHSYWDDFWVLRGLIDAADMATVLDKTAEHRSLTRLRDQFRHDLHQSIRRTISEAGIDYIPGSADLADYDATSTSIGLEPGGQLDSLPADILRHTFERYVREARARRDSTGWEAYTPYEWRNVGALVRLGKFAEAAEIFDILFEGRRPAAWNQWPEVVHRDSLAPKFLGDLPHTWVGSDFARSFLDMIAYVRPSDSTLIVGAGIPAAWVEGTGLTVRELPIGQGRINIRMTREGVRLDGTLRVPPGGIAVYRPGRGQEFRQVDQLPAEIRWDR
jgi:hypothetical protein